MLTKTEKERLKQLLSDTLLLLCQNSLPLRTNFSIEALVGLTLENDEILLVSVKKTINGVKQDDDKSRKAKEEEDRDYGIKVVNEDLNNKESLVKYASKAKTLSNVDRRRSHPASKLRLRDKESPLNSSAENIFNNNSAHASAPQLKVEPELSSVPFNESERESYAAEGEEEEHVQQDPLSIKRSVDEFTDEPVYIKVEENDDEGGEEPLSVNDWGYHDNQDLHGQNFTEHFTLSSSYSAVEDTASMHYYQDRYSKSAPIRKVRRGTKFTALAGSQNTKWALKNQRGRIQPGLHSLAPNMVEPLPVLDGVTGEFSSTGIPDPRPVYRCEFCPSFLDSKRSLQEHVNGVHFHKQAVSCKYCGKGFTWRAQLSRHRLTGACPHPEGRGRADALGHASTEFSYAQRSDERNSLSMERTEQMVLLSEECEGGVEGVNSVC